MFEIKHRVIAIDWSGELGNIRTVQFFKRNPEDLLDLAFDVCKTSRLGCQITMVKELDGLVVTLPAQHYNLIGI